MTIKEAMDSNKIALGNRVECNGDSEDICKKYKGTITKDSRFYFGIERDDGVLGSCNDYSWCVKKNNHLATIALLPNILRKKPINTNKNREMYFVSLSGDNVERKGFVSKDDASRFIETIISKAGIKIEDVWVTKGVKLGIKSTIEIVE